jgi:hypothetical protein
VSENIFFFHLLTTKASNGFSFRETGNWHGSMQRESVNFLNKYQQRKAEMKYMLTY